MIGRIFAMSMMLIVAPWGTASAVPCGGGADAICSLEAIVSHLDTDVTTITTVPDPEAHRPEGVVMRGLYDANQVRADAWLTNLSSSQTNDLGLFLENWEDNKSRYESVAEAVGLPAELVAAIHWRESTADFSTYLHQGDPLGAPAVHVPTDIPVFKDWELAAVHAIESKSYVADDLSIDQDTEDMAALATYAEYYNGLGYSYRDKPSPYVWAGTDQYKRGKFVSDGRYNSWTKDRQLGVVVMIQGIRDLEAEDESDTD